MLTGSRSNRFHPSTSLSSPSQRLSEPEAERTVHPLRPSSELEAISSSMAPSTIWSTSSPMSSPISLPMRFIHLAMLLGSYSSMSPHFDGSARLSILLSSERITLTLERTLVIFLLLHRLHWGVNFSSVWIRSNSDIFPHSLQRYS